MKKNQILDKINYILDYKFIIKNFDPNFNREELIQIDKRYNFKISFVIKRKIKNLITFIYNLFFSKKKKFYNF